MQQKSISQEELQRLEAVKQRALEVASSLGELYYQKTILELQIEAQRAEVIEIRVKESELFNELRDKYGDVSINISTGDFI